MADDTESGRFPFGHKAINAVPAVEADHQRIVFEDAVHLTAGGLQPFIGDVAGQRASLTVAKTYQIWWVGQNKIDGVVGNASHELDAVTQEKTGHKRYSSGYRGRQEGAGMAPVPCCLEPVRPGRRRVRLTVEYRRRRFTAARICRESGLKGVHQ